MFLSGGEILTCRLSPYRLCKPHSPFPRTARGIFVKWNPSGHLPLLKITENKLQRICIHKAKAQHIWSCHLSSLFFVYLVYKISLFPQHISHAPASVFLQWSPSQLLSIYLWIPLSCSQASLPSFSSLPHLVLLPSSSHNLIYYYYLRAYFDFLSIYFHCFLDNSCHTADTVWQKIIYASV